METITTVFKEISVKVSKSGECIRCGKRRRRVKKFWQTLSPFNKNADGTVKSASVIRSEETVKALKWEREPIECCL